MLEYPLWYGPFQLLALVCVLVLVLGQADSVEDAVSNDYQKKQHFVGICAGFIAIILVAIAPWLWYQYWRVTQVYLPPEERVARWADEALPPADVVPLLRGQRDFAELSITPVTAENAAEINALALEVLSYSPEARVVEKIIDSYRLLGRVPEAVWFMQRFKAAYPDAYAEWLARTEEAERAQAAASGVASGAASPASARQ
jgi:Virulence factor membrane-bound polymerase, C-terminal